MSCQRGLSRPPCRIVFSAISQKDISVLKGSNLDPQAGMVSSLTTTPTGPKRTATTRKIVQTLLHCKTKWKSDTQLTRSSIRQGAIEAGNSGHFHRKPSSMCEEMTWR